VNTPPANAKAVLNPNARKAGPKRFSFDAEVITIGIKGQTQGDKILSTPAISAKGRAVHSKTIAMISS
jgi:hypothetical protein